MSTEPYIEEVTDLEYPYYYTKEGDIPFWDNPLVNGYKFFPKDYKPYTTVESVLSLYNRRRIDETDFMILKVLGDAICCNEDQLRRYLSSQISSSETSKRLDRFRSTGLVERWKVRVRTEEEEVYAPPAPFVLGIAGFKLMKHFYNGDFFMNPNRWDNLGVGGIQRYVAMNELRCRLIEAKAAVNWKWNALVASNTLAKKPMGVCEVKTPRGNMNFLIERAQMNQNFIGFIKDKLNNWKNIYNKFGTIPVNEFAKNIPVAVIYTSTYSMAEKIHSEIMLDTFPFNVWVCIEEDMVKDGLHTAFYKAEGEHLKRMVLGFLDTKS
ncbi:hypothetical protein [Bacillus sp. AFS040349]|uniref:hypothetical protein n=1 Tax=Bacillus sp. AFS040349 TaxID=2033502 RepID=UPI000BFDDD6C|nr:hypothetical protein [Bacillus sp. AFS040349]PGT82220.1 hypothetical protein COD11_15605 [Bacillus sp. AFS040349]